MYLRTYDADAYDGRGHVEWTTDIDAAMHFDSFAAVMELWRTTSTVHPVRETDGKPNRPLTAYTIEPVLLKGTADDASERERGVDDDR